MKTLSSPRRSIGNSNGLFHGRPAPLAAVPLGRAPAGASQPRARATPRSRAQRLEAAGPRCRAWPGWGAGDRPPARLGLLGEDC